MPLNCEFKKPVLSLFACCRAGVRDSPLLKTPPVLPWAPPQQEHLEEHVCSRLHIVSGPHTLDMNLTAALSQSLFFKQVAAVVINYLLWLFQWSSARPSLFYLKPVCTLTLCFLSFLPQIHLSRNQSLLQLFPRWRQRHGPQLLLDIPVVCVCRGRCLAVALGDCRQVRPPWHPAPLHDDDGASLSDPPGAHGV